MTEILHVEFGELEAVVQRLSRAHADIANELLQLERTAATLKDQWTGGAAEAYRHAQREWRREMVSIAKLLYASTHLLRGANHIMRETEQTAAQQWP